MYQYYIYGIGIHSEIKLYNLAETPTVPDVTVRYSPLPEDIVTYTKQGLTSSMLPSRIWFRNNIGHFIIINGNEILVHPIDGATEKDLASFILGWSISFLFMMRGYSAIHCSAIEIDSEQAVLIAGSSGAGKSTTALSLINAGYRYLADDIIMIQPSTDMIIHPGFPLQKICRNIAEQLNSNHLFYINEQKDKFAYYNTGDFCGEPRKLTTMIMLDKHDGDTVLSEKITGLAKWNCVLHNLFLIDAYKDLGFPPEEKARTLELAGKLDIYKISRPTGEDTIEEVRDIIIKLLKENSKEA